MWRAGEQSGLCVCVRGVGGQLGASSWVEDKAKVIILWLMVVA